MNRIIEKRVPLTALLLTITGCVIAQEVTYKLTKVTSVTAGHYYVFEQDGYVMKNTILSNSLTCTSSYLTQGLVGNEVYVWYLYKRQTGYDLKNISLNQYLNATSSSTNLSLGGTSSDSPVWVFKFQENGTAIIQDSKHSNRFLGFEDAATHRYKAYADTQSNLSYYPHAINVYELVEEKTSPTIKVNDQTIAYGDFYTLDTSSFASGNVTMMSSNSKVASVEGLILKSVAVGTTTITVSTVETEDYEAGEAKFTLTVTAPSASSIKPSGISTTSVTTAGGFATYCYMYPLDLDGISGAKAYRVSGVDLEQGVIPLVQLTGKIQGGVPFVLKADGEDACFEIPLAESSTNVPDDNTLLGTLAPTFVPQTSGDITYFAYSKTKKCFVKIGNAGNTVPANRAYLPVNLGGAGVKALTFVFADTDGISTARVKNAGVKNEYFIFNLAGQRLTKPAMGVNIVNGTKIWLK